MLFHEPLQIQPWWLSRTPRYASSFDEDGHYMTKGAVSPHTVDLKLLRFCARRLALGISLVYYHQVMTVCKTMLVAFR